MSTPASANNQSDHKLKIADGEFQQSFAVARLAVELWKASKTSNVKLIEKASPKDFLADAWELIESARGISTRPATPVELLTQGNGSRDELAIALGLASEPNVAFALLCDPEGKAGTTETIDVLDETRSRIQVEWKKYGSVKSFDNLFWRYWCDIGEKWKCEDKEIGTVLEFDLKGKPRREDHYSPDERKRLAARARNTMGWKRRGEKLLSAWKQHGVSAAGFLALARFRRKRDRCAVTFTNTVENFTNA